MRQRRLFGRAGLAWRRNRRRCSPPATAHRLIPSRVPHRFTLASYTVFAGATLSADYVTEYSTDRIEMHVGAVAPGQRVVLVDDLIATGGTLRE